MASIKRILVLKAAGLGDLVVTLPAIESLKAAFKNSHLTLVVRSPHGELAPCLPYVDRIIELPNYPGVSGDDESMIAHEAEEVVADLHAEHFDLAVQMHGGGRYSNPLIKAIGAETTLGLKTPDADDLDITMPYVFYQPEVPRYLELVSLLGIEPVTQTPHFYPPTLAPSRADEALGESSSPFVLIHPGNGSAQRRWPAIRFAAVADHLIDRGIRPVLIGAPYEVSLMAEVRSKVRFPLACTERQLQLPALVAICHQADLLIASAGGALMVGVASGVPTVGIYTVPIFSTFAPPGRLKHRAQVAWRDSCPVCHKHPRRAAHYWNGATDGCEHSVSWVSEVSVNEVMDAISDLLELRGWGPDCGG